MRLILAFSMLVPALSYGLGGSIVGSAQIANTELSESTVTVTNTLTVQGNSYFGTAPNISTITSAGILQLPANSTITTNGTLSISTAPDIGRVGNNPSIYVDQSGQVGIGRTTLTQALHVNGSMVVSSSYRTNNGMNNDSSVNNARLLVGANGSTIDRNITGAGEALTVNQIHASATGDILQLEAAGVPTVYFPFTGGQVWGSTATVAVSTLTPAGGLRLSGNGFSVGVSTLVVDAGVVLIGSTTRTSHPLNIYGSGTNGVNSINLVDTSNGGKGWRVDQSVGELRFIESGTQTPLRLSPGGGAVFASSAIVTTNLNVGHTLTQGGALNCSLGTMSTSTGALSGCVASDLRLKKNIAPLVHNPKTVDDIEAVYYEWRDAARDKKGHAGFIAQDVEKVFPLAVVSGGAGDLKAVDPNAINAILVLEIQALRKRVERLEKR